MAHLILFGRFGEEEGAPICYATNYATLGKDKVSCCAGNPRGGEDISIGFLGFEHCQWRGAGTLFDFVGGVWSAYPNLLYREYLVQWREETLATRTTAIISYSMAAVVYLRYSEKVNGLQIPKIIRLVGPLAPFRQYPGTKHHNSAFPRLHFFSASMAAIASLRVPLVASIRAQSLNSCPHARLAAQLQSKLPRSLPARTGARSFRTSATCE